MAPNFALLVYILLIVAILRVESKQKIGVSLSIWIPVLWVMIAASRPLSMWLYPGTLYEGSGDYESGNPIDRVYFSFLIAAGVLVLAKRSIAWREVIGKNSGVAALILFAGLSVVWSDNADLSFKRWIRSSGVLISVLIVLTQSDPVEASKRLLRRCMYVLIPLSVLLVKYFRHLGVGWDYFGNTMWAGVTTHKNSLGQLACVSAVFFIWSLISDRKYKTPLFWADIFILIMSLWLLNGPGKSTSKTSLMLFLIALCLFVCLRLLSHRPQVVGKFLIIGGIFVLFMEIASSLVFDESASTMLITSLGRDKTLTGRTFLWDELMRMASKHSVLGVGYGCFWTGENIVRLEQKFDWGPSTAHNGFLDVYLDLGFVGIIFLIGFIVQAYRNLMRRLQVEYNYGSLQVIFFSMSIVYNYSESSYLRPSSLMWITLLLASINIAIPRIRHSP